MLKQDVAELKVTTGGCGCKSSTSPTTNASTMKELAVGMGAGSEVVVLVACSVEDIRRVAAPNDPDAAIRHYGAGGSQEPGGRTLGVEHHGDAADGGDVGGRHGGGGVVRRGSGTAVRGAWHSPAHGGRLRAGLQGGDRTHQPEQGGLRHPDGPDHGDLPNLYVGADGTARAEFVTVLVSVAGGEMPVLLDEDGSAVIIHENPDDHLTQPIRRGRAGASHAE